MTLKETFLLGWVVCLVSPRSALHSTAGTLEGNMPCSWTQSLTNTVDYSVAASVHFMHIYKEPTMSTHCTSLLAAHPTMVWAVDPMLQVCSPVQERHKSNCKAAATSRLVHVEAPRLGTGAAAANRLCANAGTPCHAIRPCQGIPSTWTSVLPVSLYGFKNNSTNKVLWILLST